MEPEAGGVITERNYAQVERFLELLTEGVGEISACHEVGWSPATLKRMKADASFAELVDLAQTRLVEGLEKALYDRARSGHVAALKLALYNRAPEKWRETKHVAVAHSHGVDPETVASVARGIVEAMRTQGVAALQPGGALDEAIEAEARELDRGSD